MIGRSIIIVAVLSLLLGCGVGFLWARSRRVAEFVGREWLDERSGEQHTVSIGLYSEGGRLFLGQERHRQRVAVVAPPYERHEATFAWRCEPARLAWFLFPPPPPARRGTYVWRNMPKS